MNPYLSSPAILEPRELRGRCLRYWVAGPEEGPTLMFLHGATMDHRMFNAQVEALHNDYRLLVWDAPGHGQSQPLSGDFRLEHCGADVLAVLDQEGVEQAFLCGQSLGGYIAQHAYLQAPERIRALIIIGSTPIAKAYSRLEVWLLKISLPILRWWPYEHFIKTVARFITRVDVVREYALEAMNQIPKTPYLKIWEGVTLSITSAGDSGKTVHAPLLLIYGEEDSLGTISRDMPLWAEQSDNAILQAVPAAGHNANQDAPDVVNDLIRAFVRTNER